LSLKCGKNKEIPAFLKNRQAKTRISIQKTVSLRFACGTLNPTFEHEYAVIESRPRQWADCSSPSITPLSKTKFNPANGSWRIVQVRTIHQQRRLNINSEDLKYPPTSVGGIKFGFRFGFCRKDLKYPPTAVGGIMQSRIRS
jgi:hypothetical protein